MLVDYLAITFDMIKQDLKDDVVLQDVVCNSV